MFGYGRKPPAPAVVPVTPAEWRARGNEALGAGRLQEAGDCYRQAASADPADAVAWLNLGYVLLEQGKAREAATALEGASDLAGARSDLLADACYLLGCARQRQGDAGGAIEAFRQALAGRPDFVEPLQELVPLLIGSGRAEEAVACVQPAAAATGHPQVLMLVAQSLHAAGRRQEALQSLTAVLAAQPGDAGALACRGNVLLEMGRAAEALTDFERVLQEHGRTPDALANVSAALNELERPDEVVHLTGKAAKQHPEHAQLQLNRAVAQLTMGDWLTGWVGFERRWHAWTGKAAPWERWPRWRGEDLAGRSILLVCEQGLGDSIHYLRYVPLVAARAREVVLVLQPPVIPLARGLPANCRVLPLGAPLPPVECQCPLMSLAHAFRTTPTTVPAAVPYVHVDPHRVQHWESRLPRQGGPRVGLAWSSGAKPPFRSVPLALLSGLAQQPCQFVALQPDVQADDSAALQAWPGLFDAGPSLPDFGETAALLQCLDLVITVDTSIAHVAGALGRPVWTLLRFGPDWKWLLGRRETPWYPTMRLYRQHKLHDWHEVVAEIERDLQSFSPPRQ